jgi:hypothetical protein
LYTQFLIIDKTLFGCRRLSDFWNFQHYWQSENLRACLGILNHATRKVPQMTTLGEDGAERVLQITIFEEVRSVTQSIA